MTRSAGGQRSFFEVERNSVFWVPRAKGVSKPGCDDPIGIVTVCTSRRRGTRPIHGGSVEIKKSQLARRAVSSSGAGGLG